MRLVGIDSLMSLPELLNVRNNTPQNRKIQKLGSEVEKKQKMEKAGHLWIATDTALQ